MSNDSKNDTMIAALLREREALVQRGLTDRVAEVDEQLRLRGQEAPGDAGADAPKDVKPRRAQQTRVSD